MQPAFLKHSSQYTTVTIILKNKINCRIVAYCIVLIVILMVYKNNMSITV